MIVRSFGEAVEWMLRNRSKSLVCLEQTGAFFMRVLDAQLQLSRDGLKWDEANMLEAYLQCKWLEPAQAEKLLRDNLKTLAFQMGTEAGVVVETAYQGNKKP